ncbi:MAG: InlB B-repeat-containing protein, partial [Spirochaetales bacterium]|nr:InlB B-repeat-containing protein [Spirochaetales bacterium]
IDDKGVGCKNWNIAENKTLYAFFLEKGKHSIEYRNTKGVTNIIPKEFKESDKVTLRSISTDGYTFGGWSVVNGDVTADETTDGWNAGERTADVILWARWTPNTNTAYKVEHWLQNIDGNDSTCDTTEDKTGTTGEQTAAAAKSYGNFTAGTVTQQPIAGDGSTVIKIYYTRDMIKFTFKPNGGKWSDGSTADKEILGRYQADVNKPADPTRDGYTFSGWDVNGDGTPDTVDTSFNEAKYYTAIWTSANGITVTIYNTSTISVSDTSTDESIILTAADGFSDYVWKIDGAAADENTVSNDGKTLTIAKTSLKVDVVYQISLTAKKNGIPYNARVVVKK